MQPPLLSLILRPYLTDEEVEVLNVVIKALHVRHLIVRSETRSAEKRYKKKGVPASSTGDVVGVLRLVQGLPLKHRLLTSTTYLTLAHLQLQPFLRDKQL